MLPRGKNPCGTCCKIPHLAALTGTALTAMLAAPLPELTRKVPLDRHEVRWRDGVTHSYKPHIGTLNTSPEIDSINSLTPNNHGGNMDLPETGPDSITYLPVRVPGARLFIGDAHACQGDGEWCGTAVEYPSDTTLRVDLIKRSPLAWPRFEREDFIMAIGSARPLEDATRIAHRELVLWLAAAYGFDRWDAYMLLSQCGKVRLGNFVDPKHIVGAAMPHPDRWASEVIVVVSSVCERAGDRAAGPDGVLKAALIHHAKGLSYQPAPKGIRVNALSPGNTFSPGGVWETIEHGELQLFRRARALNPTARMGLAEEMARAALFLASPAAGFIMGINLVVDGALTRSVRF